MSSRVLALGGARSGKSTWAESRLADAGVVDYVATGRLSPEDAEWVARVDAHRARRPVAWTTHETLDLAPLLTRDTSEPALIECGATWLDRVMDDAGCWVNPAGAEPLLRREITDLLAAWSSATRPVIFVSNEVGSGIVPASASARLFQDELGRLNVALAAAADEVWLITAGVGLQLK